jgi:hypothetical protein
MAPTRVRFSSGFSLVPGLLDKKGGRKCNLLLNKRWNLLTPYLVNEPPPPRTGAGFPAEHVFSRIFKSSSAGGN